MFYHKIPGNDQNQKMLNIRDDDITIENHILAIQLVLMLYQIICQTQKKIEGLNKQTRYVGLVHYWGKE